MTEPKAPAPATEVAQPVMVGPRDLRSGNVVAVPSQRDEHGNPTAYDMKAVVFVEDDYEDNQANKPMSVLYFEDGTEFTDHYPEIPKWNVVDPGVPFEAIYSDAKKGDGQLQAYRRSDGHGADVPVPDRKKPGKPSKDTVKPPQGQGR